MTVNPLALMSPHVTDAEIRSLIASLAPTLTVPSTLTGDPPLPPMRILYDPDHVVDHNTIRGALIWMLAKVHDIESKQQTTPSVAKWG